MSAWENGFVSDKAGDSKRERKGLKNRGVGLLCLEPHLEEVQSASWRGFVPGTRVLRLDSSWHGFGSPTWRLILWKVELQLVRRWWNFEK